MDNLVELSDVNMLTKVYLGSWGAQSQKPLKLICSAQYLEEMVTPVPKGCPEKLAKRYTKDGKKKVSGKLQALQDIEIT